MSPSIKLSGNNSIFLKLSAYCQWIPKFRKKIWKQNFQICLYDAVSASKIIQEKAGDAYACKALFTEYPVTHR